jgi:hypothetical protein
MREVERRVDMARKGQRIRGEGETDGRVETSLEEVNNLLTPLAQLLPHALPLLARKPPLAGRISTDH